MSLQVKRIVIAVLGVTFLASLLFVQYMEILRKKEEEGLVAAKVVVAANSRTCVDCHRIESPGIVDHWTSSMHAKKGVGCVECHQANQHDADAFKHEGALIATVVTPRDCGRCHPKETEEFTRSHHSKAGNILHSLDNVLAETVEGSRLRFNPHSKTPGMAISLVNGLASAQTGCHQCHGSQVAFQSTIEGERISVAELQPDENGQPTNAEAVAKIKRNEDGKPLYDPATWPNTGIGRLNLDGTRGSCSACHSRHDFSARRARQPENCGKCHLGPDHPQKEIYEESKHGVAYRDLRDKMNLNAEHWVLGDDYSAAPTCATCHLSGNRKNGGRITHDPGERIFWTNRPKVSMVRDTGEDGEPVYKQADPAKRKEIVDTALQKRGRMKEVCSHCHTNDYINGFFKQYDDFVTLYNEKFGKPGVAIMGEMKKRGLTTKVAFDEEIEWTWFYLWHHEGRRARHGASMMAPDYAHWHGMYEVAERFYMELIPQAREICEKAIAEGKVEDGEAVLKLIDEILDRPEHQWFEATRKAKQTESAAK